MPGQDSVQALCHVVVVQELIPVQSLWLAVKDIALRLCIVRQPQSRLDLCIKLPGCTLRIRPWHSVAGAHLVNTRQVVNTSVTCNPLSICSA